MHPILQLLPILPLLAACRSQGPVQTVSDDTRDTIPVIRLYKGTCYGRCPSYTLEVFNGGRVLLTPKRFMPLDSAREARWPVADLVAAFEKAGFDRFDEEYMQPVADVPSYRLTFRDHTVRWNGGAPDALRDLVALLDRYTVGEGWLNAELAIQPHDDGAVPGQLIVQLAPEAVVDTWLAGYGDIGLTLLRRLGRDDFLLVGYDPATVDLGDLMARLKQDPAVRAMSRNLEVQLRN